MSFRRMLPFLLLNIVVSATVVLGILYWWEGQQEEQLAERAVTNPVAAVPVEVQPIVPTVEPTPLVSVTNTPEPTSTPEQNIYFVQSGDTLGNIADTFDVPVEDIMTANGILDPNLLQIGQEIVIPIGGIAPPEEPTVEPTATTASAPTPIPTEPFTEGEVIIEIREVIGVGELTAEAVSIVNVGSRPIALQNWTLQDEQGFIYTFGQITLFGDGAGIIVHTEAGVSNGTQEFYWGLEESVWQPGEVVRLIDAEGTEQVSFLIPPEEE